jgi:hypothetical protein
MALTISTGAIDDPRRGYGNPWAMELAVPQLLQRDSTDLHHSSLWRESGKEALDKSLSELKCRILRSVVDALSVRESAVILATILAYKSPRRFTI